MGIITVSSGEARAKWRDVLDQILSGRGDVMIERNGKSVAVIIPAADYEEIRKTLDGIRATREAAAAYETLKVNPAQINAEDGTATIPLDLYKKLIAEREARFAVIREIQEIAPDLPEDKIETIVAETIRKVREQSDTGGS